MCRTVQMADWGKKWNMDISINHVYTEPESHLSLTCEPFEHGDVLEALEVVDEHVWDPEVIEELQGDWVPKLRLHSVVSPDSDRKLYWVIVDYNLYQGRKMLKIERLIE